MANAFDDLLQELADAGVQDDYIERLRAASAGSPLRKERDEARQQAEQALADANRFKTAALRSVFKDIGVAVKPDALNIPPDLDPLDADKVREWAVGMGLAEPPPPATPDEELAAHQRVADASGGSGTPAPNPDLASRIKAAKSPEEVMAIYAESGRPLAGNY